MTEQYVAIPVPDCSLQSIQGQIEALCEDYAALHSITGELFATLSVPQNRRAVECGNQEAIYQLWCLIDARYNQFKKLDPRKAQDG